MRPHHCFMYPEANRRGLKRVQPNADSRAAIFMRSSKPSTHDSETAQVQPNILVKIIFIVYASPRRGPWGQSSPCRDQTKTKDASPSKPFKRYWLEWSDLKTRIPKVNASSWLFPRTSRVIPVTCCSMSSSRKPWTGHKLSMGSNCSVWNYCSWGASVLAYIVWTFPMPLAAFPKAFGLLEEEKGFSIIFLTVQKTGKPMWNHCLVKTLRSEWNKWKTMEEFHDGHPVTYVSDF